MDNAGIAQVGPEPENLTDSVLQSAVWLAEEIGILMPSIPRPLIPALAEVARDRLFATDPVLLELDCRGSIEAFLASDWPPSGLAFGYMDRGLSGHWFYTLVGARLMLHVSLRLRAMPEISGLDGTGPVSEAHAALDRFLAQPANFAAATSTRAANEEALRRLIILSDDDGGAQEFHATWSPSTRLSPLVARTELFSEVDELALSGSEVIIRG